jgi:Na+/H+-dicarboxylate symporter
MCRTVVNVTSDSTIATIVAKSVGKLKLLKDFNLMILEFVDDRL